MKSQQQHIFSFSRAQLSEANGYVLLLAFLSFTALSLTIISIDSAVVIPVIISILISGIINQIIIIN